MTCGRLGGVLPFCGARMRPGLIEELRHLGVHAGMRNADRCSTACPVGQRSPADSIRRVRELPELAIDPRLDTPYRQQLKLRFGPA
jgi:hypothetical protein